jgi:hypothetical protein
MAAPMVHAQVCRVFPHAFLCLPLSARLLHFPRYHFFSVRFFSLGSHPLLSTGEIWTTIDPKEAFPAYKSDAIKITQV